MGFLKEAGMPVPHRFMTTAETALNLRLQKMFSSGAVELDSLRETINEIKSWNVKVDGVALEFIIRRRLEAAMAALMDDVRNDSLLTDVLCLVESVASLPIDVNLWQAQNVYWAVLQSHATIIRSCSVEANNHNTWSETVRKLGEVLYFNVNAALAARGDI